MPTCLVLGQCWLLWWDRILPGGSLGVSFAELAAAAVGQKGAHGSLWCKVGPKLLLCPSAGWVVVVEVLAVTRRMVAVRWWSL